MKKLKFKQIKPNMKVIIFVGSEITSDEVTRTVDPKIVNHHQKIFLKTLGEMTYYRHKFYHDTKRNRTRMLLENVKETGLSWTIPT